MQEGRSLGTERLIVSCCSAAGRHATDLECCAEELEVADVADPQVDVLPGHLAPSGREHTGIALAAMSAPNPVPTHTLSAEISLDWYVMLA